MDTHYRYLIQYNIGSMTMEILVDKNQNRKMKHLKESSESHDMNLSAGMSTLPDLQKLIYK